MKRFAAFSCILFLAATAAVAGMKVTSKSWDRASLASYETYTWHAADSADSGALIAEGTKLAARLESIGDQILSKAGLEKNSGSESGLVFRYRGLAADVLEIEGTTKKISDHATWVGDPTAHSMTSYKKGALLIEVLDAETDELLWAGWAVDVVDLIPDRQKLAKKAEKAMAKIIKLFPVG
jgi:hypothetical protein